MTPISSEMRRALRLAQSVIGLTSPNPAVGAVVVLDQQIIGEGATQRPGESHAEIIALQQAGHLAAGADLYVTLEPCSTYGRTPPCTQAIINSGIRRVFISIPDSDPAVNGRGIKALREAGLDVKTGDGGIDASRHYEAYIHHRRTGQPFVIAKFAISLDGKIAATSGDSRWISSAGARNWAHANRATVDAILVGVETILIDDPQLTARPRGSMDGISQPLRIVLDSHGRTPITANITEDQDLAPTLIATIGKTNSTWRKKMQGKGVRICEIEEYENRVSLRPFLKSIADDEGIISLLVEGGGQVHGAFFDQGLVNKVHVIIAPLIIGGDSRSAIAGHGATTMSDALRLRNIQTEQIDSDIILTGYPNPSFQVDDVTIRPAGTSDRQQFVELVDKNIEYVTGTPDIEAAFQNAKIGNGAIWVAVAGGQLIGGIILRFETDESEMESGKPPLIYIEKLYESDTWRGRGIAERMIETAEASASGRGANWILATVDSISETSMSDNCWSREDWKRQGYRYYKQTSDESIILIKSVT